MAIPRAKTELEIYLEHGIDERNRRIFFGKPLGHGDPEEVDLTDFTPASVQLTIRAIKRLESDHPTKPIEIHMCSAGGDPEHMMYLVDTILYSTCKFIFYGGGRISSAATWVMATCDERWLYPNTQVMVHDGTAPKSDKTTDGNIDNEQNKRYQKLLEKIYEENSRMPKEFWEEVCKRDLWISAEETIMLGLADKILQPKKRGTFRRVRQANLSKKIDKRKMKKLIDDLYKRIELNVKTRDIKLHIPKEEEDKSLVVDNTPVIKDEILSKENNKEQ